MTKVLQFPTKEVKRCNLEIELDGQIEALEETYQILDSLHEALHRMEEETSKLEKEYEKTFEEYISTMGGVEQIPEIYVSYSVSGVLATEAFIRAAVLERFNDNDTIFDIAEEFGMSVEAVTDMLGVTVD